MIEYEVNHLHLFASNVVASAHWYRDKLGAEVVESRQSDGEPRVDLLLGGLTIHVADGPRVEKALGQALAAAPTEMHYGLNHFGLRVRNVDEAVDDLRAKGVTVTFGPKTLRPGARVAYIEAPDGVSIEILSRDLALDQQPPTLSVVETTRSAA